MKKGYSYLCMWMTKKLAGKKQNNNPMWKVLNKEVDLGEPTSFLDHVHLECTQRQCQVSKDIVENYRAMFESRISAGGTEKLPYSENRRISSWSYDMEGHAIRIVGMVHPIKSNQNLRVFWKPVNPQDCVWKNLYRIIMKTILQEKETIHYKNYYLVHKFIPMPQAMKIPAAKTAVDKEWEKLEKISAWNLTKVRSKKEVIDEARTKGAKVHFASLMDMFQLKSAELETKHQKYKGRVVLRGDIVKDDSGSYAVFTEQ